MRPGLIQKDISDFLNFSRWIAAFFVLIAHIRSFVYPTPSELVNPNVFLKFFYFITSLGHEAVLVFFVLSGYLIGGEVINGFKNNTFIWKNYLLSRITRLYVVLIPAMLLTVLFDNLGYIWFDVYDKYFIIRENENLFTFLMNIFMLQNSYSLTFGSNSPLWSLANEFWYYLLFPLIVQLIYKKGVVKIFSFLLLITVLLVIDWQVTLYFLIWLLGVGVWGIKSKRLFHGTIPIMFLISIVISRFTLLKFGTSPTDDNYLYIIIVFGSDMLLGIMFMLFIYQFKDENPNRLLIIENIQSKKFNKIFADFSYSLYLYHFPFLFLLSNITFSLHNNFNKIYLTLFFIVITYLYAYFLHSFTEAKTTKVKKFLLKRFS